MSRHPKFSVNNLLKIVFRHIDGGAKQAFTRPHETIYIVST